MPPESSTCSRVITGHQTRVSPGGPKLNGTVYSSHVVSTFENVYHGTHAIANSFWKLLVLIWKALY